MSQVNLTAHLGLQKEHDEQAQDLGFISQYLAAMTGFLLGEKTCRKNEKLKYWNNSCNLANTSVLMSKIKRNHKSKTANRQWGFGNPGTDLVASTP